MSFIKSMKEDQHKLKPLSQSVDLSSFRELNTKTNPKNEQLTKYFGNYRLWKLEAPKIKEEKIIDIEEVQRQKILHYNKYKKAKKNISDLNIVSVLRDDKLDKIFSYLAGKRVVSKENFFRDTLEILGKTKSNVELLQNVYEMVDLDDTGYIRQELFVDFLFEQGISKIVKPDSFHFEIRKELRLRAQKIVIYEQIGMIGVQEKYSFKFYMIRIKNFNTFGIVDIPKNVHVQLSKYLLNFEEILVVLSDKTLAYVDRKDFILKRCVKLPES